MGGELAGSHLPDNPSSKWKEAVAWFTQWERYTTENQLISPNWKADDLLPKEPYISNQSLAYELQLDYTHRQQCLIKDIVQSDRCQTPYMQTEWLEFILNTSQNMRENRTLFKEICKSTFPQLFSIPTDANNGLPLSAGRYRQQSRRIRTALTRRVSGFFDIGYYPNMNYINFESELRTNGCLYSAAKSLIDDFSERDIVGWFDASDVWTKHQSGENLANEIRVICSLELYLSS